MGIGTKIPIYPTRYSAGTVIRYRLSATNVSAEFFADGGEYYPIHINDHPTPEWEKQAVVYQIFTDRFYDYFKKNGIHLNMNLVPNH